MKHLVSASFYSLKKLECTERQMCLWQRRRGASLKAIQTELKGRSEMAFSITMINIFSLVRAFSFPVMSQLF